MAATLSPILVTFAGGSTGTWRVCRMSAVRGEGLPLVQRLAVLEGDHAAPADATWIIRGVTSHQRYTTRAEEEALAAHPSIMGRPEATEAALIPIRKTREWWGLAQDERRAILEERSGHIATGLEYVSRVARRLHHGRDLGEPFDFLTWFEFAPEDAEAFEGLVARLRATEEWVHVDREVDIRLTRE